MRRDGKTITWRTFAAVFAIALAAAPAFYLMKAALEGAMLWQMGRLEGDLAPAVAAFAKDSLLESLSAVDLVDCLWLFVGLPILFFFISMIEDLMADTRAARKSTPAHEDGHVRAECGKGGCDGQEEQVWRGRSDDEGDGAAGNEGEGNGE